MKKLAVIGCGGIGSYHLSHFLQFKDIELAGFCDLIPERAESFAKQAGGGLTFTCYKEMLDMVKPDMVFVCIPPTCHGEVEFEIIKRGIPFFVEKPVALDLELAKKIRDEVKKAGLITASGFQCRYSNLNPPVQQFISDNEVVFIECARIGGVPMVDWWRKRSTSGGQIVEQTIHQFDIIRYLYGEPESVFTFGTKGFITEIPDYDTEDVSVTAVKFKNGALGMISTGCYAKTGAAFDSKITFGTRDARLDLRILDSVDIHGLKAVEEGSADKGGFVVKGDGGLAKSSGGVISFRQDGDAGILCDRTFIDAVISGDGSAIKSPYKDAIRSLAFTLACNRSMDTGKMVKIDID